MGGGGVDLFFVVRQWPCKMIAIPVLTNSLLMSLPMGSTKMHGTDPRFSTSKSTCRPPSFWADSPDVMKWVGAFLDSYSCLVIENQRFECSQVFQVLQSKDSSCSWPWILYTCGQHQTKLVIVRSFACEFLITRYGKAFDTITTHVKTTLVNSKTLPWKEARRSSTSTGTQCPWTGICGASLLFKVTSSWSGSLTQETERL